MVACIFYGISTQSISISILRIKKSVVSDMSRYLRKEDKRTCGFSCYKRKN